ncbi:unnamed protein product [Gordionus sp. m RMFG-2023]|uniref:vacuolar protein sorting-associated protein 51 homolog n=1 Tax=Gordionus sp. m RMFG-2023 TaxID=3053472 RepID=UPI0030DFAC8F
MEDKTYDLNSEDFDVNSYVKHIIKDHSLNKLMEQENNLKKEIKLLDNDMQSLVYENYNKFINATDIVQNLKCNFSSIESLIEDVSNKMDKITSSHKKLLEDMKPNKEKITKYIELNGALRKMQFLFDLPDHLKKLILSKSYSQALKEYIEASKLLEKHQNFKTFEDIASECKLIMISLHDDLLIKAEKSDYKVPVSEFFEIFDILKTMSSCGIAEEQHLKYWDMQFLSQSYLEMVKAKCCDHVNFLANVLETQNSTDTKDYSKFSQELCQGFLKNFASYLIYHKILFKNVEDESSDSEHLLSNSISLQILSLLTSRILFPFFGSGPTCQSEHSIALALDKLYFETKKMSCHFRLDEWFIGNALIPIIEGRIRAYAASSCSNFNKLSMEVRQKLAKLNVNSLTEGSNYLREMAKNFLSSLVENIKNVLRKLTCYTSVEEISYSTEPEFAETFLKSFIFGQFLFPFFRHFINTLQRFEDVKDNGIIDQTTLSSNQSFSATANSSLSLLFFSRVALDFYRTGYDELVSFAHDTFRTIPRPNSITSPSSNFTSFPKSESAKNSQNYGVTAQDQVMVGQFEAIASAGVSTYARSRGVSISKLAERSAASRDWLGGAEPRTPRAALKRVREEIEGVDLVVGQLFDDQNEKQQPQHGSSHSSSRKYSSYSRNTTNQGGNKSFRPLHSASTISRPNLLHSHISKIFSEKIVIYEPVNFNKNSILTGIIKICLKSFLESIRLKTLSTYGFQQIQVDLHYLQLYLWRFVSNEKILQSLLDEILSSAALRCTNPILMEQSVVDIICEK